MTEKLSSILVDLDLNRKYIYRALKLENLEQQIGKLADFIIAEIDGEPSQSEGAIDCAIRIMREQKAKIGEEK